MTLATRAALFDGDERERDIEAGRRACRGIDLPPVEDRWLGLAEKRGRSAAAKDEDRWWWRVWDVSANCTEIGTMETYGTSSQC